MVLPCCAAVSASISEEGSLSAVGAPLCELGDDGTEGRAEESGAASVNVGHTVKLEWTSVGSRTCTVSTAQVLCIPCLP